MLNRLLTQWDRHGNRVPLCRGLWEDRGVTGGQVGGAKDGAGLRLSR